MAVGRQLAGDRANEEHRIGKGQQPTSDAGEQRTRRHDREEPRLPNPQSRTWTPQELSQLVTVIDAKVAERIGRTPSVIAKKRIALGIASMRVRTARETAGGPEP